jgi:hypothetical protein
MALNQAPYEWTIRKLLNAAHSGSQVECPDGRYEPARPYGLFSLRNRFRLAWMVFKGEADALRWPFQNPKAY